MPATVPVKDQRLDCVGLAAALFPATEPGKAPRTWVVYGIKKANRLLAAQGREDLIFSGRYSTPGKLSAWLDSHPDFVANQVLAPGRRAPQSSEPHGTPAHPPA
jgi:hypothetical protein